MMFDLDRFKAINDTHGHAVGDAVIRKFCEVTAAALRPNDVFGRIGGEEFAVVLPGSSIEAA
jgi:diguanylate cyclase (GGDEF)-like protein